jgi:hypothetical protein
MGHLRWTGHCEGLVCSLFDTFDAVQHAAFTVPLCQAFLLLLLLIVLALWISWMRETMFPKCSCCNHALRSSLSRTQQLRPSGVVAAPPSLRSPARTAVRYKSGKQDPLEILVEQASQVPVVQLPAAAAAGAAAAVVPARPSIKQHAASISTVAALHTTHNIKARTQAKPAVCVLQPGQQELQQSKQLQAQHTSSNSSLPKLKLRPSLMDFETMFEQLVQWKAQHLSAHVPRFCFDAPELGAWVRYMRKQHKDGLLEQWKVER